MPYEEEILRHPYSVKCWLRYIEHKIGNGGKDHVVNLIYERALKELPGRCLLLICLLVIVKLAIKNKLKYF